MKKIITLFILLFTFLGCKEPDNTVQYLFPNRMKKIEGEELAGICRSRYKMALFSEKHTSFKAPSDSVFIFTPSGEIRNSKSKIGAWRTDRTLFLDAYNKRFFFFNIGENSTPIALKTHYKVNANDSLYKDVIIGLVNENYKPDTNVDGDVWNF
ncbi:hypothetical protein [Flavobacterium subsaxonicum]|uniref:Lipoprotein n=1 Tax=Flavobacterium subsaxonicum WB 4.1-42 = DSM 21790 TaxID=1121898 RepID=A0A0A2MPR0_9FLAO|nr:hypothetical protein [Flavobacterium subsaxonicum]KGO93566.1 hypothetical protein Q766_06250 [Flavobacterium subsaxonicum WB 4.1-42 = DSM 21790]